MQPFRCALCLILYHMCGTQFSAIFRLLREH